MYKIILELETRQAIGVKTILPDGGIKYIPFFPGNRDYEEYLEWLAAGNIPEPADDVGE